MSVSDEPGNGEGVSLTACVALKVSIGSDRSWHLEVPIKSTHVGPTEDDNPSTETNPGDGHLDGGCVRIGRFSDA